MKVICLSTRFGQMHESDTGWIVLPFYWPVADGYKPVVCPDCYLYTETGWYIPFVAAKDIVGCDNCTVVTHMEWCDDK